MNPANYINTQHFGQHLSRVLNCTHTRIMAHGQGVQSPEERRWVLRAHLTPSLPQPFKFPDSKKCMHAPGNCIFTGPGTNLLWRARVGLRWGGGGGGGSPYQSLPRFSLSLYFSLSLSRVGTWTVEKVSVHQQQEKGRGTYAHSWLNANLFKYAKTAEKKVRFDQMRITTRQNVKERLGGGGGGKKWGWVRRAAAGVASNKAIPGLGSELLRMGFTKPQLQWPTLKIPKATPGFEVLLYVHKNRRFIRDGSPGRPSPLSHTAAEL